MRGATSNPRTGGLRDLLASAEGRVIGTFLKLAADEAVDIVAGAGFDLAIVDLEHSQLDEGAALRLIRRGSAIGLPMVVRVPRCDPGQINRALEAGASGIQLSTVRTSAQVRDLVAATRFAPGGRRSVSLAHPMAGYGSMPLRDAIGVEPPLLVGQIETVETDDPLAEIMRAGLDVAFVGVTDLTVDAGFDQQLVAARIAAVRDAARDAGVALGAFAPDASSIPPDTRYVAVSSDLTMLRAAAGRTLADAR